MFTDPETEAETEIEIDPQNQASIRIQSVARSKSALEKVNQRREEQFQQTTQFLLANEPGFVELMSDVLRNTVFNLVQEASFGEFPIDSDPISFVLKRK